MELCPVRRPQNTCNPRALPLAQQLSLWYAAYIYAPSPEPFFLVALAGSVFAQNLKPVADRLAAQNALFDEQYESDLRNFPERATAFGDYRYNDKLADHSLDAIAQRHKTDEAFLARLEAIPTHWLLRPGPALPRPAGSCPPAAHRRLRPQRVRDADQPAEWHPYQPRRSAAFGPSRLRQALRGLHRASSPDPPRPQPDHRSPSRRHERQAHARPIPARETSRPVPGHHRRRPFSASDKKVSC